MKPPKQVQIGTTKYDIKLSDELSDRGTFNDYAGISIDKSMPEDMMAEVLLHEVLHSVVYTFNMRKYLETKVEEAVVSDLSTALSIVIRDNPKLIRYLVESLK